MTTPKLFAPARIGDLDLANRVVMAPLTRSRATPEGDVPNALHVEYYRQRASAGLIVTEATQISPEGKGYAWTPGIYSDAQVAGWRKVTDAVHASGGRIVLQLWHVGRISHVSLQQGGKAPVAPSAIAAKAEVFDGEGRIATSTPRALELDEFPRLIEDYRHAARNAKKAGFDGVEIHAANGYLIDQFLRDGANQRTDAYGGPVENRVRLLAEVIEAVTEIWPAGRVGVRLSPFSPAGDLSDSNPMETFAHAIKTANEFGLAYIHLVETDPEADYAALRQHFDGAYIANFNYDRARAIAAVETGAADLVAFGRPYIANPDLLERLKADADLNEPDPATFYGGGAEGYTSYPALNQSRAA